MKTEHLFSGLRPASYRISEAGNLVKIPVARHTLEVVAPDVLMPTPELRVQLTALRNKCGADALLVLGRDFIAEHGVAMVPLPQYHLPELRRALSTVVAATFNKSIHLLDAEEATNWILRTLATAAERVNKDNNA